MLCKWLLEKSRGAPLDDIFRRIMEGARRIIVVVWDRLVGLEEDSEDFMSELSDTILICDVVRCSAHHDRMFNMS